VRRHRSGDDAPLGAAHRYRLQLLPGDGPAPDCCLSFIRLLARCHHLHRLHLSRLVEPDGDEAGLTQSSTILGSAGYLAPEQARGEHTQIGPATDVFALGCILYRALTGASAFPARSPAAAIFEAIHHHPPPPSRVHPGIPTDVDAVIALALAKAPNARYRRAGELAHDLRLAFAGQLPDATLKRARALETAPASSDEVGDTDETKTLTGVDNG
jgi:serine/threonine protein kinase